MPDQPSNPASPADGGAAQEASQSAGAAAGTEHEEITAPESGGWWQFKSKDDAAAWANDIVEKRLARERKKYDPVLQERDTLKAEIEELRPLKEATLTDSQRWESEKSALTSELEELRAFRQNAERTNLVREIAEEKGLPAKLVKWVSGDDADSITQSVEELLNDLSEVGQTVKKPAQRKPKESDGDEPGKKGYASGGGGNDDGFSTEAVLQKMREHRANSFAR